MVEYFNFTSRKDAVAFENQIGDSSKGELLRVTRQMSREACEYALHHQAAEYIEILLRYFGELGLPWEFCGEIEKLMKQRHEELRADRLAAKVKRRK